MPKHSGPVRANLKKKKNQGRRGWKVTFEDLNEAIKVYAASKDENGNPYDYVVFSVNGPELSILGVNKDNPGTTKPANTTNPSPEKQPPVDPGEFDQFPVWP